MDVGNYTGTLATSGSSFSADNKTITVTMRVTNQPIAQPSTAHVTMRLAQGAPASPVIVVLNSDGKQLTTQDSGKLEEGDHHSPEKVLTFLEQWSVKK